MTKTMTFSTTNRPDSWDVEGDVITFATPEDAKKAETLYRQMSDEINRLRAARPEAQAHKELRELYEEWPGGLGEIQSSLDGHRRLIVEAATLLRKLIADRPGDRGIQEAVQFLVKHDAWLKSVTPMNSGGTCPHGYKPENCGLCNTRLAPQNGGEKP